MVVGDIDTDGARRTADEVVARGGHALGLAVNVVDIGQVEAMITAAIEEFGAIDGLVNLAFYRTDPIPLMDMSLDALSRELHIDVVGCLLAMQAVQPHLRGRNGSIVNFSSSAGINGQPGLAGYSAAKAAIRGLSRTAALEWAREGVRVNAVCPFSLTPSLELSFKRGTLDRAVVEAHNPMGRIGDAETDIGPGVVFLLSDDSRYITGQTLPLDGGSLPN